MFENNDLMVELEVVLHKMHHDDLLHYMIYNVDYIAGKLKNLLIDIDTKMRYSKYAFTPEIARMYYLMQLFIELWNRRN